MSWPSSFDTFNGTSAQGTSLLTAPDHAQDHRTLGSFAGTAENIIGLGGGTPAANTFFQGIGGGSSQWGTAGTNLTFVNSSIIGGTFASQIQNNGTINGHFGSAALIAPTITGAGTNSGTIINGVYNNPTFGTPVVNVWNNWIQANETGTMLGTLSANGIFTGTMTVQATASNKYDKGDKLNFTQGGTNMYMYVYSIPTGTTLLVTGGTDYAPGTTAITNLLYSKAQSPNGFPGTFNYNPNETWTGTAPTTNTKRVCQFSMQGNMVYVRFYTSYSTAGSATQVTINQPIPSLESSSIYHDFMYGAIGTADNTAFAGEAIGAVAMFSNTTIQNGPYGAAAQKSAYIQGFYAV